MDEKGFIISTCQALKRVFSRVVWKSGRRTQVMSDGSREFISLLVCICTDRTVLPPSLIYPSESKNVLDTWTDNVERGDVLHVSCSPTGWLNNRFGLTWLKKVFEPWTRQKYGARYRLLIVNSYSSYVNMIFIEFCIFYRIILLILPLYTTYRL